MSNLSESNLRGASYYDNRHPTTLFSCFFLYLLSTYTYCCVNLKRPIETSEKCFSSFFIKLVNLFPFQQNLLRPAVFKTRDVLQDFISNYYHFCMPNVIPGIADSFSLSTNFVTRPEYS